MPMFRGFPTGTLRLVPAAGVAKSDRETAQRRREGGFVGGGQPPATFAS